MDKFMEDVISENHGEGLLLPAIAMATRILHRRLRSSLCQGTVILHDSQVLQEEARRMTFWDASLVARHSGIPLVSAYKKDAANSVVYKRHCTLCLQA